MMDDTCIIYDDRTWDELVKELGILTPDPTDEHSPSDEDIDAYDRAMRGV